MARNRHGFEMVDVEEIHELPGMNPNVMGPEQEQELEASVRRHGWRQTITLVERAEGGYWLSDGAHRLAVARRVGGSVPALIKPGTLDDVRAERLALNRIRGSVDLQAAADELRALTEAGWTGQDFLAAGFQEDEVAALLAQEVNPGLGDESSLAGESSVEASKRYSLTLVFDREEDRDRAKLGLLSAGATAESGLLSLLSDHS